MNKNQRQTLYKKNICCQNKFFVSDFDCFNFLIFLYLLKAAKSLTRPRSPEFSSPDKQQNIKK